MKLTPMFIKVRNLIYALCISNIFASRCHSELFDRPSDYFDDYDMLAVASIVSISEKAEFVYAKSEYSTGYGYMANLEVQKALKLPVETNNINLVVPSYENRNGRIVPCAQYLPDLTNAVTVKLAGKWNADKTWIILNWILSDQEWERYQTQIDTGRPRERNSETTDLIQRHMNQQVETIKQIENYAIQMENGIISLEEYEKLTGPLWNNLNSPLTFDQD